MTEKKPSLVAGGNPSSKLTKVAPEGRILPSGVIFGSLRDAYHPSNEETDFLSNKKRMDLNQESNSMSSLILNIAPAI